MAKKDKASKPEFQHWECSFPDCGFILDFLPEERDAALARVNKHKAIHAKANAPEETLPETQPEAPSQESEPPRPPDGAMPSINQILMAVVNSNQQMAKQLGEMTNMIGQLATSTSQLNQMILNAKAESEQPKNQPQYVIPSNGQGQEQPIGRPNSSGFNMETAAGLLKALQMINGGANQAMGGVPQVQQLSQFLDALKPILDFGNTLRMGGFSEATDIFSRGVRAGQTPDDVVAGMESYVKDKLPAAPPPQTGATPNA